MRGDIQGSLGRVTKGDPGESAYQIAVRHGFVGTEDDWLASLSAQAAPAEAAATLAENARVRAESAKDSAEDSRDDARTYARNSADSASEAYDSRTAAAGSARVASTSAATATEAATYIQGQVASARNSAEQAALSESHAHAHAGASAISEAHAKQSELLCAEMSVTNGRYADTAEAAASSASASAAAALGYKNQTQDIIDEFNANTELAHTYATQAGSYASTAQGYAVSAADSARRAEEALGHALEPLDNYYTKAQTNEQIDSVASGLRTEIESDYYNKTQSDSIFGGLRTEIASDYYNKAQSDSIFGGYYTKSEVDSIVLALPKMKREIVTALPTTGIDLETIYMLPNSSSVTGNIYDEYMYINGAWEVIGTTEAELSNYETTADIAPYKNKVNGIEAGAQVNTITGVKGNSETNYRTGNVNLTKANIGLGNVDNTADANKSVSYAATSGIASALNNASTTATYSVGDVVFKSTRSPSTCFVCVSHTVTA